MLTIYRSKMQSLRGDKGEPLHGEDIKCRKFDLQAVIVLIKFPHLRRKDYLQAILGLGNIRCRCSISKQIYQTALLCASFQMLGYILQMHISSVYSLAIWATVCQKVG